VNQPGYLMILPMTDAIAGLLSKLLPQYTALISLCPHGAGSPCPALDIQLNIPNSLVMERR